jgi:hypothetical protein
MQQPQTKSRAVVVDRAELSQINVQRKKKVKER